MKRIGYLTAAMVAGMLSVSAFAQNAGGGGNPPAQPGQPAQPGGNQPGRNRGGDGRDWRQQWNDRLKEQLGASEEEFKALQPKIQKVQDLQRQQMASRFGGGMRRGGPGGGDNAGATATPPPANPLADANTALRTTLENKDATAADIKAKLDAVRAAKAKNQAEVTAAQKELKELLSQRQEAVLVQMGVLD